jgi:hypothetical protein
MCLSPGWHQKFCLLMQSKTLGTWWKHVMLVRFCANYYEHQCTANVRMWSVGLPQCVSWVTLFSLHTMCNILFQNMFCCLHHSMCSILFQNMFCCLHHLRWFWLTFPHVISERLCKVWIKNSCRGAWSWVSARRSSK